MSLDRARGAAAAAGVTRLADITRLDRIGVPVFQAVRPWGRALSVHQGKGIDVEAAQIGALMEAVESHHAEAPNLPVISRAFDDLPVDERARHISDFAVAREVAPSTRERLDWVAARRIRDGGVLWVPFEVVSLDFRGRGDARWLRSSNGLGAHWDLQRATLKGLLEVVERDAEAIWRGRPSFVRTLDRLDLQTVPIDAVADIGRRVAAAGLTMAVYHLTTVIGLPAFVAEIIDRDGVAGAPRSVYGAACDSKPHHAIVGAVLEAVQSRATMIAGVRDDIGFDPPASGQTGFEGFGLPLPPNLAPKTWGAVTRSASHGRASSASRIARMLARAGYDDAAVVDLSRPGGEVVVVKVLVPGLACRDCARRDWDLAS